MMTTAFQRNAFQNNAFQIDALAQGGAFTKRPDRIRRWRRAEDEFTPEELAREVALIERHLERARQTTRAKTEREAAANAIQELAAASEQAAEIVAETVVAARPRIELPKFNRIALAADLDLMADIATKLDQMVKAEIMRLADEDDIEVLLLS